jgi:hypothetical protein
MMKWDWDTVSLIRTCVLLIALKANRNKGALAWPGAVQRKMGLKLMPAKVRRIIHVR